MFLFFVFLCESPQVENSESKKSDTADTKEIAKVEANIEKLDSKISKLETEIKKNQPTQHRHCHQGIESKLNT